jgi:hypothetical protein
MSGQPEQLDAGEPFDFPATIQGAAISLFEIGEDNEKIDLIVKHHLDLLGEIFRHIEALELALTETQGSG